MIGLLLFLSTGPLAFQTNLTWYEHFEQGERQFRSERYVEAISSFQAALQLKPTPQINAFTRAVQTIEYKPYYYLALCYERTDRLEEAYRAAQRAVEGEVVSQNSLYLKTLAPIMEKRLAQLANRTQEFDDTQVQLQKRLDFFKALSAQRYEEAQNQLDQMSPSDRSELEPVLSQQRAAMDRRNQLTLMIQRYTATLEELIDQSKKATAQALLDSMETLMERDQFEAYQIRIAELAEPELPQADPEPTEPDPEITRLIANLTEERDQLEDLLARDKREISNLNSRILSLAQNQKGPETPFEPQINVSYRVQDRSLTLIGQLVSPTPIQKADITVGNQRVPLEVVPSDQGPLTLSFEKVFTKLPYGPSTIIIAFEDIHSKRTERIEHAEVPRPWFTQELFLYGLGAIAFLIILTIALIRRLRRRNAILQHFNPYIAGVPVREKDMFFGRDQLIERIEKLVQKNCLMIFGQRRIGKTSLLHQLHQRLKDSNHPDVVFFPVFIDLQGVHEEDLFHLIMEEILNTYDELETHLDLTFEHESESYSSRQFSKDLKKVIEYLKSQHTKNIHIVFLMDEVDAINDFSEKTNQKLRGIFMKTFSDHLSSVMAGIHLKKHWESSGSPWYNFFEEIPMTHLAKEAARDLITDPVKGIFTYENEAIDMILNESGCQPFLIQKICVSLLNQQLEMKLKNKVKFRIQKADVENVLAAMRSERKTIEGVQN